MKKLTVLALTAIALVWPRDAHAVSSINNVTISWIENGWYGEGLAFAISGVGISGCGASNEFAIPVTASNYKDLVAMVLSAYLATRSVNVVVNGGTCAAPGNRTQIVAIHMQ